MLTKLPAPLPFLLFSSSLLARCAPKISARKCRRVAHGLAHLARGEECKVESGNCLCVLSFDLGGYVGGSVCGLAAWLIPFITIR